MDTIGPSLGWINTTSELKATAMIEAIAVIEATAERKATAELKALIWVFDCISKRTRRSSGGQSD